MKAQNVVNLAGTSALVLAVSAAADQVVFQPADIKAPFIEQFTTQIPQSRWTVSKASVKTPVGDQVMSYVGAWAVEEPEVFPGIKGDMGLVLKSKAAHHAISTEFEQPINPADKPLVVQYEVKLQKGLDCGGAYIKLLTAGEATSLEAGDDYNDKTPFTIMFGPDKCGSTNKVHFIFRHKNPVSGEWEEKHLKNPPSPKITKTTALYTLIVNPDQTFKILINDEVAKEGSLLEDFDPPVNPSKEIDDPDDFKPDDWVDTPEVEDAKATKPADWDEDAPLMIVDTEASMPVDWLEEEPETIPDPDAEKPEEWDDEEDGDWIAPMVPNPKCEDAAGCGPWTSPKIRNPEYKGAWTRPMIPNPDYKGPWSPKQITNPAFFEDLTPSNLTPISGIGIELWTMTEDILFDNMYVGHSEEDAKEFAKVTYHVKKPIEQEAEGSAEEDEEEEASGMVDKIRLRVYEFIHLCGFDIMHAVKSMPDVAAGLSAAAFTLIGMLLALFGLIGSKPNTVKKTSSGAPVLAEKATEPAPTANAGDKTAEDDAPVKKRATRSTKD